jgi:hypothetical protein
MHTAAEAAAAELDGEPLPQGESCPLPAASSSWAKREPPLGGRMVWRLLRQQKRHLLLAGMSLVLCVSMNLASPVLQGMLFDVLVRGQPFQQYSKLFAVLLTIYVAEPLLSQVQPVEGGTAYLVLAEVPCQLDGAAAVLLPLPAAQLPGRSICLAKCQPWGA